MAAKLVLRQVAALESLATLQTRVAALSAVINSQSATRSYSTTAKATKQNSQRGATESKRNASKLQKNAKNSQNKKNSGNTQKKNSQQEKKKIKPIERKASVSYDCKETELDYWKDTYQFQSSASVLKVVASDDNEAVILLDKTIFHPRGGGQPSDQGTLVRAATSEKAEAVFTVIKAAKVGPWVAHHGTFTGDLVFSEGDKIQCNVDESFRRLHARLHSAGHLLDLAVANAGYNHLIPTKGHHEAKGAYVEYAGAIEASDRAAALKSVQKELNALIEAKIPTYWEIVAYEDIAKYCGGSCPSYMPVGKPARIMWIAGKENVGCPCGGTHVKNTADLGTEKVKLIKLKKSGKALRFKYEVAV